MFKKISIQKKYTTLFLLLYAVLVAIGKFKHELWRDEIHGPLISKSSQSIAELLHNIKYEGHPPLPYFIYYLGHLVQWPPLFLSVLFFGIAILAMCYMLQLPVFTNFQKILLITNYYFLYEFGVFNRVYIIIILLLMYQWMCIINNKKWGVIVATLLGVSIHAEALPIVLIGYLYYNIQHLAEYKKMILPSLAILVGTLFTLYFCIPPSDSLLPLNTGINLSSLKSVIASTCAAFNYGFLYVQASGINFWGTSVLQSFGIIFLAAGALYLLLFAATLKKSSIVYLGLLVVAYLLFFQRVHFWGIRHFSFSFLSIFVVYILNQHQQPSTYTKWPFTILLVLWSFNGIKALGLDWKYTFSNADKLVQVVKPYQQFAMCTNVGYTTEAIHFFDNKNVYALDADTITAFAMWQNRKTTNIKNDSVLYKFASTKDSFIYIHSMQFAIDSFLPKKMQLQQSFSIQQIWNGSPTTIVDENFKVYLFARKVLR
jgi:hypothetical protein